MGALTVFLATLAASNVDATVVRWELISGGPDARDSAAAAYGAGKILVFGGRKGTTTPVGDTWLWDGLQWKPITAGTPPAARFGAAMAYDASRKVFVLFGGTVAGGALAPGDTYHFDPNAETWLGTQGAGGEPPRTFAAMAYDRVAQAVTRFGGTSGGTPVAADLRQWNGTSWTVVPAAGGPPPSRSRHGFVYDDGNQSLVLYGGLTGFAALDDAWQFKAGVWTQLSNAWIGMPRHSHGMVFDTDQRKVLIYGGRTGTGAAIREVWVSNGATTSMIFPPDLPPALAPVARFAVAMVYDETRKRAVVIGGSDAANLPDPVWSFFLTGQPCTQNTQCATAVCVTGVCCLTPCDPPCRSCDQVNQSLDPNAIDGECRRVPPGKDPRFCNSVPACEGWCTEIATCAYPGTTTRCGLCKACNDKSGECDQMPADGDDPSCMPPAGMSVPQCSEADVLCRTYAAPAKLHRCLGVGKCGWRWSDCSNYLTNNFPAGCPGTP